VNKNEFYAQMPEADKDDLVALAADGFLIQVTEVNGEAKLLMTPGVGPTVAAEGADVIEADWATANP